MSTRDLGFLGCRGLSLYALVLAMGPLGQPLSRFLSGTGEYRGQSFEWAPVLVSNGVAAACYLAASLGLWACARPLARAMAGPEDSAARASGTVDDWRPFAVRLVGLLMIALCLPQAARLSTSFYLLQTLPDDMSQLGSNWEMWGRNLIPKACEIAIRLFVGLWLLLGTGGILRALHAAREERSLR